MIEMTFSPFFHMYTAEYISMTYEFTEIQSIDGHCNCGYSNSMNLVASMQSSKESTGMVPESKQVRPASDRLYSSDFPWHIDEIVKIPHKAKLNLKQFILVK